MNHPALEIDYDPSDELKLRYELLCQQHPNLRSREAAKRLNVTEAELLASCANDTSFHLMNHPEALLSALQTVGEVLIVTRNESVILEKKGTFKDLVFDTQNGFKILKSDSLGLHLLLNSCRYTFLVIEEKHIGHRKSLQFFDRHGQAVQKIYLTQNSNEQAFEKIITRFISSYQPTYLDISKDETDKQSASKQQATKWPALSEDGQTIQSSHDFFKLLIGRNVSRQQAYDNVGRDLAYEIVPSALQPLCEMAKQDNISLTLAVGNSACMQFHSGPVDKAGEHGQWFNMLNSDFNLYTNSHRITQAWVIRKPQQGNPITLIEFFDDQDHLALQITAINKPDIPESSQWRELVAQLPPRSLAVSALNTHDAAS